MALTGLQIYKLLPQTNCKECGFPTCLAFAMKLAAEGHRARQVPVRRATRPRRRSTPRRRRRSSSSRVGADERDFEVGNEVVLFRHEKTFYHQPGLVVRVKSDDAQLAEVGRRGRASLRGGARRHGAAPRRPGRGARRRRRGRVRRGRGRGPRGRPRPAARPHERPTRPPSTPPSPAAPPPRSRSSTPPRPTTGRRWPRSPRSTAAAGDPRRGRRPLGAWPSCPSNVHGAGVEDLVIDPGTTSLGGDLAAVHAAAPPGPQEGRPRRWATRSSPVPARPTWQAELVRATQAVAKYAGVVVLDHFEPGGCLRRCFTLRQNIYTDPQKPIQVEPKLYEIGDARRRQPGAGHHQLLAHLLLGVGRGGGRRRAGLAARRRQRRPVGAHRLGGRQVRRREDRQDGQGLPASGARSTTRSWSSPGTSPACPASSKRSCPAGRSWSARATPSTSPTTSRTSGARDAPMKRDASATHEPHGHGDDHLHPFGRDDRGPGGHQPARCGHPLRARRAGAVRRAGPLRPLPGARGVGRGRAAQQRRSGHRRGRRRAGRWPARRTSPGPSIGRGARAARETVRPHGHAVAEPESLPLACDWRQNPAVRTFALDIEPPSLADNTSDFDRLRRALSQQHGIDDDPRRAAHAPPSRQGPAHGQLEGQRHARDARLGLRHLPAAAPHPHLPRRLQSTRAWASPSTSARPRSSSTCSTSRRGGSSTRPAPTTSRSPAATT